MNCPRCNTDNDAAANFCRNCGTELHLFRTAEPAKERSSSILMVVYLSIALLLSVAQFAIQKLADNWYDGPLRYVQGALWLIQNLSFIMLPLAIRNKNLRGIGLAIAIPLVIYWVFLNVQFLTR